MNDNGVLDELVFDLENNEDSDTFDGRRTSASNLSIGRNSRSPSNDDQRTVRAKVGECLKNLYVRLGIKHLVPFVILLLYSAAGGAAFYYLESPNEVARSIKRKEILKYAKRQVQERVWELHVENFTRRRILFYAAEALDWYENYTSMNPPSEIQWDFWGSVFYCGTIYTTIGYGNIAPITTGGQVLTMVYSAIGIPLILFILNDMGEVIGKGAYRVWSSFQRKGKPNVVDSPKSSTVKRNISFNDAGSLSGAESASTVYKLPMSVAFGITLTWMLVCSAIFALWENWTYFTAFYFFFISLTTIGLGDIVPRHHHFLIMNFGLVLLGLALVSMCIKVVQAKVEYIAQQLLHRISKRYQTSHIECDTISTMAADELQETLNQIQQPSWLKALVSRSKKEKIMNEYRKRTKMRAKGVQTFINCYSIAVQTEDTIDWRKHYERELVNVQNLISQLEQIYSCNDKKTSTVDEMNLLECQQNEENETKRHKLSFRRFSPNSSFRKMSPKSSPKTPPFTEPPPPIASTSTTSSPPKASKRKKSFRKFAGYVSNVLMVNRKTSAPLPTRSTSAQIMQPFRKKVVITLNDDESSLIEPFDDKHRVETSSQLDVCESSPVSTQEQLSDENNGKKRNDEESQLTETLQLPPQQTFSIPSPQLTLSPPSRSASVTFPIVVEEEQPEVHHTFIAPVTTQDTDQSHVINKISPYQQRRMTQRPPATNDNVESVKSDNSKMYNAAEVQRALQQLQLQQATDNKNGNAENALSSSDNVEVLYRDQLKKFDLIDDEMNGNSPSSTTPSVEIHKATKSQVSPSPRSSLSTTSQLNVRRKSTSGVVDDDERFPRIPYALDDCKLLFAEIKHRITDCRHILNEQRTSSRSVSPSCSTRSLLSDRPLTLRQVRHGFGGGNLLRREIGTQAVNGRR